MGDIIDLEAIRRFKREQKFDELVSEFKDADKRLAAMTMASAFAALDQIYEFGLDVEDNPRCIADIYLLLESIAGVISRVQYRSHGIHNASDAYMGIDVDDVFEATERHIKLMNEFMYGRNDEDA